MLNMTLGSLFDGIGGFPLAALRCGITPVWASEIEKVPIEITKKHFPNMKHLGDITKIDGAKIEPVDVMTFGSPCQDLSIAGGRKGLDGEKSSLFLHAIRIVRQMRQSTNSKYPRFIVWENVPGAFSSNKGQDFRRVLEEITNAQIPIPNNGKWATAGMVELQDCQLAWRTLDAQFWGVPQRRRRIFLVADFTGQSAAKVLFECESVRGNFAACQKQRQEVAGTTQNSTRIQSQYYDHHGADSRVTGPHDIASTVCSRYGTGGNNTPIVLGFQGNTSSSRDMPIMHNKVPTMKCKNPLAVVCIQANCIDRTDSAGCNGKGAKENISYTLNTVDKHAVCYAEMDFSSYKEGPSATLKAKSGNLGGGSETLVVFSDKANTLRANAGMPKHNADYTGRLVMDKFCIRRLTPLECERLQGFPDDWTTGHSDTQRYKALGNSVAIPCVQYVLQGIARELNKR